MYVALEELCQILEINPDDVICSLGSNVQQKSLKHGNLPDRCVKKKVPISCIMGITGSTIFGICPTLVKIHHRKRRIGKQHPRRTFHCIIKYQTNVTITQI